MADLITSAQTDSTTDGSGPSTSLVPPQLDNAADDCIIVKVTQSLNNATSVSNISVTTPSGYTLLTDITDSELRSWVFYKRSTGSETIPAVTSDTASEWSCSTVIVVDVDWANGGLVQHVQNTAAGDHQSPDLTTDPNGAASAIVCLYSVERRSALGFRYPETRPQTVYAGAVSTGNAEGIDNASAVGFDFTKDRNTNFEGPFWEATGGGDSIAINIEIIVQGNIVPLQIAELLSQPAPTSVHQTDMNWCREIVKSGKNLDGTAMATWTFDASSDVNASLDEITITGHGMDESMIVHLDDGGNTSPSGLANDTFYYAFPQDADTIKLCSVNEDSDVSPDFYYFGTTQRPIVDITGAGLGAMTLTEARMLNAGQAPLDITRPGNGDASNVGPAPGNYIGDAGYQQNWLGTAQRFSSLFDATDKTFSFDFEIISSFRLARGIILLIDEDGDWASWTMYLDGVSLASTGDTVYQLQADKATVQGRAYQTFGSFDATRIRYFVIGIIGNNNSTQRFGAARSLTSILGLANPLTIVGGKSSTLSDLAILAAAYTEGFVKPSDLQFTSRLPINIGDGAEDVSFVDSEKSLAFPPLADGVTSFESYLETIGVAINATAASTVKLTNSQIGASVPFDFQVQTATGSTIDFSGNTYVFGTVSLDADLTYNRQLFVGGKGVTDNNAEIKNSTFIVNDQLGADKGIINYTSSTDIESSTFELSSGTTTGHAIKIETAGTYTFADLAFSNFGADESNIAAVYNNSGGAVTINVAGGSLPTVRNGAGASTTVTLPPNQISVTGIAAGSRLRIYNETTSTEVYNDIISGTSYADTYTEGVGYSSGDVLSLRLAKIDKLEHTISTVVTSTGWATIADQQDNVVYASYGVNGAAVTGITWDSGNMQFDFSDADNQINGGDIAAWYFYFITTEIGISEAFGAISWPQANRISNITGSRAITFDNTKTAPLQIKNAWIDRDDGATIISSASHSIQIDPPAVFVESDPTTPPVEDLTNLGVTLSANEIIASPSEIIKVKISNEVEAALAPDLTVKGSDYP